MKHPAIPLLLIVASLFACQGVAGDWPQFRYDAGRTAATPHGLPSELKLSWTRELGTPQPAFPQDVRLAYDASYEPVVLGSTVFVPSMVHDSVTALNTRTGVQRWQFFAGGPVRFAPVAWDDKVYFVSDDGYLYCLQAKDGSLLWKFRGLPAGQRDRKVIGHGRLVSLWPARGGPVLDKGVVYFAAGLWPTEGVYVHGVNAQTGQPVWSNTEGDHIPRSNWDHGVGQYSGLTPQGYLAIVDDRLVVPCGSQLPAFLDLESGQLQKYTMGWGGRNGLPKGCWFVAGIGRYLSHSGDLYDISRPSDERFAKTKPGAKDYKPNLYPGGWTRLDVERANQRELDSFRQPVMTTDVMYESDRGIVARDLTNIKIRSISPEELPAHRKEDPHPDTVGGVIPQLWTMDSKLTIQIKAGDVLYVGGPGQIQGIDLSGSKPEVTWSKKIEGTPQRMLAADDRLFVVTLEGSLLAFAAPNIERPQPITRRHVPPPAVDAWTEKAKELLTATDVRDGYALVLGIDEGRLIEELARQSNLHVIGVDEDLAKITKLRAKLHAMGLYGTRVSVLAGDPVEYSFSPYLASLVVSETPDRLAEANPEVLASAVYHTLRPYGGVACASGALADRYEIDEITGRGAFPGATIRELGDMVLLSRSGGLPGAADWSHAEANAACTGAAEDEFVRAPVSVLWFDAAQRWHKYPGQVQVRIAGGRQVLFEEGVLRASDIYTGRRLWEIQIPLGVKPLADAAARERMRYARHRQWGPPASLAQTSQLVVTEDSIYVSAGTNCLVYDAATGNARGQIALPAQLRSPWSNLRISGEFLVGSSGAHVLCVHRHTGKVQWQVKTSRPNLSIAVGNGKVFCSELIDERRGENEAQDGNMFALNLVTGDHIWRQTGGSRLRYSQALDVVVTPAGFYSGTSGEPTLGSANMPTKRLVVAGKGLPKTGIPGFIAGTKLLTGNEDNLVVVDITSGKQIGKPMHWARRGCTGTRASTHLLTTRFRGNSAWIDLENRELTPLLGVRPGCSVNNNLYPANGLLNIPNLTAGCTCNYAPVSVGAVPTVVLEGGTAE